MPPKGWKKTAAGFQPANSSFVSLKNRKEYGIEDLLLPRSLVLKIAREALPPQTPVPKDGVTALMRAATMFISYITATANDIAAFERRKTVTQTDILQALEKNHFGQFTSAVIELSDARQAQKEKNKEQPEISEDPELEEGDLVANTNKRVKRQENPPTEASEASEAVEAVEANENEASEANENENEASVANENEANERSDSDSQDDMVA